MPANQAAVMTTEQPRRAGLALQRDSALLPVEAGCGLGEVK
jgi:hypothetical protein